MQSPALGCSCSPPAPASLSVRLEASLLGPLVLLGRLWTLGLVLDPRPGPRGLRTGTFASTVTGHHHVQPLSLSWSLLEGPPGTARLQWHRTDPPTGPQAGEGATSPHGDLK